MTNNFRRPHCGEEIKLTGEEFVELLYRNENLARLLVYLGIVVEKICPPCKDWEICGTPCARIVNSIKKMAPDLGVRVEE